MDDQVTFRPASLEDTPALLAIERASFADPWNSRALQQDCCVVAEASGGAVVAFLIWREIFPATATEPSEIEILNVAVHPDWRRQGLARRLLLQLTALPAVYFLEVRESNDAARALYRHLGFVEVGRRKKYYRRPVETAIVMRMKRC